MTETDDDALEAARARKMRPVLRRVYRYLEARESESRQHATAFRAFAAALPEIEAALARTEAETKRAESER